MMCPLFKRNPGVVVAGVGGSVGNLSPSNSSRLGAHFHEIEPRLSIIALLASTTLLSLEFTSLVNWVPIHALS